MLLKLRTLFFLIVTSISFSSCLFQKIDYSPIQEQAYFRSANQALDETEWQISTQTHTEAGWAKVNITPEKPVALAGYGKRLGKKYEHVLDSIYIRAFVFKNDTLKTAFVTADLLIIPMEVTAQLQKILPSGFTLQNTYFTATHTHHSIGNWARKPAGFVMAGRFRKKRVKKLALQIAEAIKSAEKNTQPVQIGFTSLPTSGLIKNRMIASGIVDSTLRVVKLTNQAKSTAIIASYAAHPTNLKANDLVLSGDYPAVFVQNLEHSGKVDFAAFSAGAVGSQNSALSGPEREKAVKTGKMLASKILLILDDIEMKPLTTFASFHLPVCLPKPSWRIGDKKIAPGVFHTVFGKYPVFLNGLALNELVLLNVPADYSAEFIPELQNQAKKQELQLILNSFNGGYVGYVLPEDQYHLKRYESRDMNFYGPHAGTYFQFLLKRILEKYKP